MKLHFALPLLLIATLQFALSPSLRAGVVTFNTNGYDLGCALGGSEAPQHTNCTSDAAIDYPGVYSGIGLYLKSPETSAGDNSSGYYPDTFSVTLTDTGTINSGSISINTPVYLSFDNLGLSVDNDGYITQYSVTYTLTDTSSRNDPTVVSWTDTVNEPSDPDSLQALSGGGVALAAHGLSNGDGYDLTETVTVSYVVPDHHGYDDDYEGGGTTATIAIGDSLNLSTVAPEPASFVLAGVALAGLGWLRRKRA
jgi:hypothetical protein